MKKKKHSSTDYHRSEWIPGLIRFPQWENEKWAIDARKQLTRDSFNDPHDLGPINIIPAIEMRYLRDLNSRGVIFQETGTEEDLYDQHILTIDLDLSASAVEIRNKFESILKKYKKIVPTISKKDAPTLDIWWVYDLHHYDKMTYAEIARLNWNSNEENLNAREKSVKRAYSRAVEILRVMKGMFRNILKNQQR